jgi:hypothetical protein
MRRTTTQENKCHYSSRLPIDVLVIADLDDENDKFLVLNRIENSKIALPDSIKEGPQRGPCSCPALLYSGNLCGRGFSPDPTQSRSRLKPLPQNEN